MYKDISIKKNQDCILIERESHWKKKIIKAEHHSVIDEGTPYEDGIEAHLDGISMQVVKHRMVALRKDKIAPLTGEENMS